MIGTQETAEYIVLYRGYEVHLLDTPGFDDDGCDDAHILQDIANRINIIYLDGIKLSGILYLHDITQDRVKGTGIRSIRLLEEILGSEHWNRCTLVTTKWSRMATEPERAIQNEVELQEKDKFWKAMRTNYRKADMKRFGNTQDSALEIINPYLNDGFVPQLTHEMVDPTGPKHTIGATKAGQQVSKYLIQLEEQKGKTAKIEASRKILQQKFNEKLFHNYQRERSRILTQQKWTRGGRWVLRLVTLAGCIAGTVVTFGAAAPTFAAVPLVEVWAQTERRDGQQKLLKLDHQYEVDVRDAKLGVSSESLNKKGYAEVYGSGEGAQSSDGESWTASFLKPQSMNSSEGSLLFKGRG
jgi:hypothetical protein